MPSTTVIFDLGKVLLDFDYAIAFRRLAGHSRVDGGALRRLVMEDPLLLRYESGAISSEEFYEAFRQAAGFTGAYALFREAIADIFTPIEPMLAFHAQLRARGVRTFIFSNTNEIAVSHIRERYPFFSGFDGYIYSFEHRAMKPDLALYRVVESCAGAAGADLFYIDDRPENIETARGLGWNTVVHESPERTLAAAGAAGLPTP